MREYPNLYEIEMPWDLFWGIACRTKKCCRMGQNVFIWFVDSSKSQREISNSDDISKIYCPHCVERSHVYPQVSIRPPYNPAADHRPYRPSWPRSWEMINDSENSSLTNKRRSLDLALIFNDNLPTPTYTYVPSTRAVGTRGAGNCPSRFWFH